MACKNLRTRGKNESVRLYKKKKNASVSNLGEKQKLLEILDRLGNSSG